MSTYVGQMYEVRVNGKWELLKVYSDADFSPCSEDGEYGEGTIIWKSEKNGKTKCFIEDCFDLISDYNYQDLLLNSEKNFGYIDSDLGMPDDASEETKKKYMQYEPNASIPSYYYWSDLISVCKEYEEKMFNELAEDIDNTSYSKILMALNNIEKKLSSPDVKTKPSYLTSNDKVNIVNKMKVNYETVQMIQYYINVIRTLVNSHFNFPKITDVRIIWFVY